MRCYLFLQTLFLALIVTLCLPAQNQQYIDSLNQELLNTADDSLRIEIYGKLSWRYAVTRVKTEIARKYADSIKQLADPMKYPRGIAKYHYYYGVIDRFEGHYESGLKHLRSYINHYQSLGDSSRVAGGLFQMASIYTHMGNLDQALALQYRILSIEQSLGDYHSAANAMQSIGIIFRESERYQEAKAQYIQALQIFDSLNALYDQANAHVNLGNIEVQLQEFSSAQNHYQQALRINREIENGWGEAMTLANIAYLHDQQATYDSALVYHLQALSIRNTLPSQQDLARSLLAVGHGYMKVNQLEKAYSYMNKSLELAQQIGASPVARNAYLNLTELYERQENYKEAYLNHQYYTELKDSILNENVAKQMDELNTKYETAQKDKEISLLSSQNSLFEAQAQRQRTLRNALIGGVLMLAVIAGLIFYTMRQRMQNQKVLANKNEEIKVSNLKEQLKSLEFKALRAQMNPHFLFNCLNSINRMIMSNDNDHASRYLTKFSKLVRLMLENSEQPEVSLKDELDMLEAYIQLESIRFKNKIEHQIKVDPAIDQESCQLPSMVLQPFVENAIWHGLLPQDQLGKLTINIAEKEDLLQCIITDNGIGREESSKIQQESGFKKRSMGIKITDERLKLLSKQQMQEVIKITDLKNSKNEPVGTQVNVLIPVS